MEVNEYKIKLSGSANIPQGLINGKGYDLTISDAEVRKIERIPNDSGQEDEIASLKISEMSEVNIISEKTVIKARKRGSQSQKLRFECNNNADHIGRDREEYYKERMSIYIDTEKQLYD